MHLGLEGVALLDDALPRGHEGGQVVQQGDGVYDPHADAAEQCEALDHDADGFYFVFVPVETSFSLLINT